ncbi:substrate-binding domain-containing protein (plasmid) [Rhizobium sp. CB3090]|uniref:substrate-binding domain-containing protein n=1 Tax=Rhizobium sp. CB3090 TaxID=3039156 RepID=UPI0024B0BA24|nr:substrate-binding domain-containing protein [Rhizobium sp. CB3090]WFU11757.1 substrate-binding domain-containing protein [Rhizobium sp. CB3090]
MSPRLSSAPTTVLHSVQSRRPQIGAEGRPRGNADIRIAGHDDHPLSRYACPPITAVAQNVSEIGGCAVNMLLAMLGEADSEKESFSPTSRFLLSGELGVLSCKRASSQLDFSNHRTSNLRTMAAGVLKSQIRRVARRRHPPRVRASRCD